MIHQLISSVALVVAFASSTTEGIACPSLMACDVRCTDQQVQRIDSNGCVGCGCCPLRICLTKCANGYTTDPTTGCQTCDCNTCPAPRCRTQFCPRLQINKLITVNGCQQCTCCPVLNNCKPCTGGHQTNARGCPICACKAALQPPPTCDIICPMFCLPFCGTDGQTYCNDCLLSVANCKSGKKVTVAHTGACSSDTACKPPACTAMIQCLTGQRLTTSTDAAGCNGCPQCAPCPLYPCAKPQCDNPIQLYDAQGCPECWNCPVPASTCQPIMCLMMLQICSDGQQLTTPIDANGCPTGCQTCTACPSPVCNKACMVNSKTQQVVRSDGCTVCMCCPVLDTCQACPNGYTNDANGCPTCNCQASPPKPPPCMARPCMMPVCSDGQEITTPPDVNGCPQCPMCTSPTNCPSPVCNMMCIATVRQMQVVRSDGCKVCACCPILGTCPEACPNGYATDANGCPTCKCQAAPPNPPTCSLAATSCLRPVCSDGQQITSPLDANGCPQCPICTSPPKPPPCMASPCMMPVCSDGQEITTPPDVNGCPQCPMCTSPTNCPSPVCNMMCIATLRQMQVVRSDGCKVCACCPILGTCPDCVNGYANDKNGCPTCNCQASSPPAPPVPSQCQPPMCPKIAQMPCPDGQQLASPLDANGCPMCPKCTQCPPMPMECPAMMCAMTNQNTDSNGCPTCPTCGGPLPAPCPAFMCPMEPASCPDGQALTKPPADENGCSTGCPTCQKCPTVNCFFAPSSCPDGQVIVTGMDDQGCPLCKSCQVPCPAVKCMAPPTSCPEGQTLTKSPPDANGCSTGCIFCSSTDPSGGGSVGGAGSSVVCPDCMPPVSCPSGQVLTKTPPGPDGCPGCPTCSASNQRKKCPTYYCFYYPSSCPDGQVIVTAKDPQGCPMCSSCQDVLGPCPAVRCMAPPTSCPEGQTLTKSPPDASGCSTGCIICSSTNQ